MLKAPGGSEQARNILSPGPASDAFHLQQLSSKQSLNLVKIFINASLGCICFSRGLIDETSQAFQNRRVDDLVSTTSTTGPTSYESFLSGQNGLSTNEESQQFKILVRGGYQRADRILDLVVRSDLFKLLAISVTKSRKMESLMQSIVDFSKPSSFRFLWIRVDRQKSSNATHSLSPTPVSLSGSVG